MIARALRETFKKGYHLKDLHADIMAGFIVSLIALPLSMALAIAVGLPPQHGLYTAIVAGAVAALFGGSMTQISGPTAAFVVILAPIVASQGLKGLVMAQALAGCFLVVMGVLRLGRIISYIPYPVITGFTAGIAVVLATISLNDFLGLGLTLTEGYFLEKLSMLVKALPHMKWQEALVGGLSLFLLIAWPKWAGRLRVIPSVIVAVGLASVIAYFLEQQGVHVATINSVFSYVDAKSVLHQGIPSQAPHFTWPIPFTKTTWGLPSVLEIQSLFMPALVIAILAALESLLSATVADNMAGTKHHADSELFGIGTANIVTAFFAGMPATGAIARTATNIKNGARSPFASLFHALWLLGYMVWFASLIGHMPMASLSALLLVTAWHMSHFRQALHILRVGQKTDALVLLTCFALTVLVDMVAGVTVGVLLAVVLFIRRMVALTEAEWWTSAYHTPTPNEALLPEGVGLFRVRGPLFFGSASSLFAYPPFENEKIHTLLLYLEQSFVLDMTALMALEAFIARHQAKGITVIIIAEEPIRSQLLRGLHAKVRMVESEEEVQEMLKSPTHVIARP